MRKLAMVLGLFVLVAAPLSAGGIGVGYSTWDTDTADDDQGASVKVEVDCGKNLDIEARVSFFDSLRQINGPAVFEIEATPIDLGVNYDFAAASGVSFYVAAGATMLLINPNELAGNNPPSRPRSQEEFGWYGGLGLEFAVASSFSIYAEALYRDASGEVRGRDLGTLPASDFEIDFGGGSGTVGLMFTW